MRKQQVDKSWARLMHANPMLHNGAWVGADNSSLQGSPPHAEFCAIITCTLLDCILYLMQYPYDPGTLLRSANYCIPGKVYLYPIYPGIITCWIPAVCSLPGGHGHLLKHLPSVIPSQSSLDSLEGIQIALLAVVPDELVVVMPLLTGQHLEASKS